MVLYRSLTVGLLGACLYFLVELSSFASTHRPRGDDSSPEVASAVTVIDVASGVDVRMVPSLVHLAPGERITAVGDRPVASDLDAGAAIVERYVRGHGAHYIDITVDGHGTQRRVLVLMH